MFRCGLEAAKDWTGWRRMPALSSLPPDQAGTPNVYQEEEEKEKEDQEEEEEEEDQAGTTQKSTSAQIVHTTASAQELAIRKEPHCFHIMSHRDRSILLFLHHLN